MNADPAREEAEYERWLNEMAAALPQGREKAERMARMSCVRRAFGLPDDPAQTEVAT
ncbi:MULTISPECIES: hypothetical protein [Streptomyces]|uniref:hypothetical protein n=1 Tax=Streptomyces TaxID=1883 RepID=UPI00142D60E8|nr:MULTISPECIES: hypothetical protein [Streptomyces]